MNRKNSIESSHEVSSVSLVSKLLIKTYFLMKPYFLLALFISTYNISSFLIKLKNYDTITRNSSIVSLMWSYTLNAILRQNTALKWDLSLPCDSFVSDLILTFNLIELIQVLSNNENSISIPWYSIVKLIKKHRRESKNHIFYSLWEE